MKKYNMLLVSCFYIIKSKFSVRQYIEWIQNFFRVTSSNPNITVVVFTDSSSIKILYDQLGDYKVAIIPIEMNEFYMYKYKNFFINNQTRNELLASVDWRLIMLWCEKISFVKRASGLYPPEDNWVCWCDIGYFRNREKDLPLESLQGWGNIPEWFSYEYIYYGLVSRNQIDNLKRLCEKGEFQVPVNQISIAGGFFICGINKLYIWSNIFEDKLNKYIKKKYIVKDDQIIIADCIFSPETNQYFRILVDSPLTENKYDPWFPFQRILAK